MVAPDLVQLERQSVQVKLDAKAGQTPAEFWAFMVNRTFRLPAWGTRERERRLRSLYRHEYFSLAQSAFAAMTKKWAVTAWSIKGRQFASRTQSVLRNANFGGGWTQLVKEFGLDFLRQDGGAYLEIIARGDPMKAPIGPMTGIALLDSLHCYPTGDPQYPVIYTDRLGAMHLMHHTRVLHMVDSPDGDERNPGYGMCALSRGISFMWQQVNMLQYIEGKLDDKPPPGHVLLKGITRAQRIAAYDRYTEERRRDELPAWGRTVFFESLDTDVEPDLKFVPFAQAPENWQYKDYMEVQVNAFAMAMGMDVQEIWQLSSGRIGTGQQSQVLHEKSQGRLYGDWLVDFERQLNDKIPLNNVFGFMPRDSYRDQAEAAAAQMWSQAVMTAGANLHPDEARRVLANKIDAFRDAITDEQGKIVRLDDVDASLEGDTATIVDDTPTPVSTPSSGGGFGGKALQSTSLDFESAFGDFLTAARNGDMNRRRAGIVQRDLVRTYGRRGFSDGLKDGGVSDGALDDDDETAYADMVVEQNGYVTPFLDAVYSKGLSDEAAAARVGMWLNGVVMQFYNAGLLSADANGYYEWSLGATREHCDDCPRLAGQVHRIKDWSKRNLLPRRPGQATECGGFACLCRLTKVGGPAYGGF